MDSPHVLVMKTLCQLLKDWQGGHGTARLAHSLSVNGTDKSMNTAEERKIIVRFLQKKYSLERRNEHHGTDADYFSSVKTVQPIQLD